MDTVLIVDDNAVNRKIIRAILSKSLTDIDYLEADDGFRALELLQERKVSVVLLDIMMPNKDGIEVLTEMKASPVHNMIPVIICSAVNEIESIQQALALGALDYFTKPLKADEIKITLPLKVKNALEVFERENRVAALYEQIRDEMVLAETIQKSLIVGNANYEQADTWGRYIPCNAIGGDLVCSKQVGQDLWFLIADVAGHGVAAAMLSAMLNSIFRIKTQTCNDPGHLLKELNQIVSLVFTNTNYGLVSAFAGQIKGDRLIYANAGHPYPVFYNHKENTIAALQAKGLLLGFNENNEYDVQTIEMNSQDAIVLYTDGIYDKGIHTGYAAWDLVHKYCRSNLTLLQENTPELLDRMIDHFQSEGNCSFVDDVAVLVIRKHKAVVPSDSKKLLKVGGVGYGV